MSMRLTAMVAVQLFQRAPQKLAKGIMKNTIRCTHLLRHSPNGALDKTIINRYRKLKYPKNKVQVTYLWIDGTGEHVRLKDRVLDKSPKCPEDIPKWHYDGSSTFQSIGENSDVTLVPRTIYKDPFKVGKNDIIVMCDTYYFDGKPTKTNFRQDCVDAMEKSAEAEPWFGIEQEFVILDGNKRPFGWPNNGYPAPQGPYYCAAGGNKVFARDLMESHALACMYAGITYTGTNSEVTPAQWEYQIGPSPGMKAADDLWVSRYILWRIAEEFGLDVTFDPKPIGIGDWNGSGAHHNMSTKATREEGGMKAIEEAIEKLSKRHKYHIAQYDPKDGEDNKRRLKGRLETSSINKFTWAVAHRGSSIRIPRGVAADGKGYFEDRRPSSNCDPYRVCSSLVRTVILNETGEGKKGDKKSSCDDKKSSSDKKDKKKGAKKSPCSENDKKKDKKKSKKKDKKSSCGKKEKKKKDKKSACGSKKDDKKKDDKKSSCGTGTKADSRPNCSKKNDKDKC